MRLVRKLVLAIFLAFLPVLVTTEYLSARQALRLLEDDSRRDLTELGQVMGAEIARDWEVNQAADVIHAISGPTHADPDSRVRWVPADAPESPADPERIEVSVPVDVGGVRLGTLELSESRAPLHDQVMSRTVRLIVQSLALLIVSLAVAFTLGARLVGARVAQLVEHARRVGLSDLSGRVQIDRTDEIAALAAQMNAMTDALAEARGRAERATAERMQALSQLRHADRLASIGRLASALAHELGTPLNVVLGRAKLIADGACDTADTRENIEIIREQAQRMTETIREVLGFARRAPAPPGRVDLRDVARRGQNLLEPLARRAGVTIELQGGDEPAFISGRIGEIEQVVANLLTNAIDALSPGGRIEVLVATVSGSDLPRPVRSDATYQRLTVRDDGPGIPPAELSHVFEPFFTTKPEGSGTGLGLWIVEGIVRDHRGFVDIESRPESGTCFSIHIPAERA